MSSPLLRKIDFLCLTPVNDLDNLVLCFVTELQILQLQLSLNVLQISDGGSINKEFSYHADKDSDCRSSQNVDNF